MLAKLLEMKKFNLAYSNTTQLYYGTIDMTFHSKDGIKNPNKVARDLSLEITGMKQPKETHFVTSFGHLMGYSAGYYGYLWSKVYAIDMYSLFEENGLINSEIGARYRKEILEVGSMRDASESLKAFLKRGPKQEPFYRWLGI
jgi:thimet oligopeptidase